MSGITVFVVPTWAVWLFGILATLKIAQNFWHIARLRKLDRLKTPNVFSTSSPLSASDRIWTGLAISDQSGCPSIDTLPRMRPVSPRARAVRSVIFQILRSMSHFAPIAWACVRTVRSPNPMLT